MWKQARISECCQCWRMYPLCFRKLTTENYHIGDRCLFFLGDHIKDVLIVL
jgi:hypothetical protein